MNQFNGGMQGFAGNAMGLSQPRTVIQVGFEPATVPENRPAPSLTPNAANVPVLATLQGVHVQWRDGSASTGVAVLTGTVPTAHDSQVAMALLMLEPGVRAVDNQLVVGAGVD